VLGERCGRPGSTAFTIRFDGARTALGVHAQDIAQVGAALAAVGLSPPRPVLVLVGGAGGLSASDADRVRTTFLSGLVPVLHRLGAAALDGGTRSGVMRILGETRAAATASFPLVGVVAAGTVRLPGERSAAEQRAELDPDHTHFLLVPGEEWGAESPWLARAAAELARPAPSVTVLVNGGEISYADVALSVAAGRPVLTVAGSGRTADELAEALRGGPADERAVQLVRTGLVHAVPVDDPSALGRLVADALGRPDAPRSYPSS
jgi:hypothetical protein